MSDEFRGPWFNTLTAARYTDKPSRAAFRMWAVRNGIVHTAAGCLYAKADIDRVLQREHEQPLRLIGGRATR